MVARRCGGAAAAGIGDSHPVFQAGRQREAQAMTWAVRHQRQPFAVMEQLLVPGNAPKRERGSILRRIGVGFDGGDEARAALRAAAAIAREHGARLRLVAVADLAATGFGWAVGAPYEALREAEHANLRRAMEDAIAALDGVEAEAVVREGRADAVLAAASGDLDLLVVGSRNYGPLRRALLGTVSGRVADDAACPVLVVPRAGAGEPAAG